LAGERKLNSTLLEPNSIEKIYEVKAVLNYYNKIDRHIGCTASGFIPDARSLVEYARV
jgi:20S proteasome subunit alpha 5